MYSIPMTARNTGTGATTFCNGTLSTSGLDVTLPSGYDEVRGFFVVPLA